MLRELVVSAALLFGVAAPAQTAEAKQSCKTKTCKQRVWKRNYQARLLPNGEAVAPKLAPKKVKLIIKAGNRIARKPYRYGGGHGGWRDSAYDCSGSVSYALRGAKLVRQPMASGGFYGWGKPGKGRWVTIYTNQGHMYMVVAGLRFDTSGRQATGSRWQPAARNHGAFVARNPPGKL